MKFKEEEKRLNQYRRQGKSESWLKGWLRGWRQFDNPARKRK